MNEQELSVVLDGVEAARAEGRNEGVNDGFRYGNGLGILMLTTGQMRNYKDIIWSDYEQEFPKGRTVEKVRKFGEEVDSLEKELSRIKSKYPSAPLPDFYDILAGARKAHKELTDKIAELQTPK